MTADLGYNRASKAMSTDSEARGVHERASEGASGAAPSGRVLSGKFRVRELLGAGGMGAVYVAEHAITRRIGALKLLHASFAQLPETRERFLREASAAGLIGNPHIVETYDAGTLESGEPYIFMELLSGSGLDHALRAERHLELEEALDITIQAARALHAAHQAGIIHRDVKPANLFLLDGPRPFVKVLDFGISKFAPSDEEGPHDLTREGALLGTPVYMSPEQVMGHRDLDARTDVYSLAVVLYELLTGDAPFHGGSLMQLSANICQGNYVPAGELRKDLPTGLEAVIEKALHRDRNERFSSAEAFAEALLEFCPELGEAPRAPSDRASARVSRAPSGPAGPVSPGGVRTNGVPEMASWVEAPTLEPHSTTDRVPRPIRVASRSSSSKRALWAGMAVLAVVAVWFAVREGLEPPTAEPEGSASPEVIASVRDWAASMASAPSPGTAHAAAPGQVAPPASAAGAPPSSTATLRVTKLKTRESVESPASTESPATSAPAERDGLTVTNPFH
jgi:eukaryotic-like serine/threonine-protein kinase